MEKKDESSQDSESGDSSNAEVVEEMEDEQLQANSDEQMRDDQRAELRNETSADLTGGANYESEEIPQPKVEQCEDSMSNVLVDVAGSTGMESEAVAGECQKQSTTQVTATIASDAAAEEVSEQSEKIEYNVGKLINDIFDAGKSATESSNIAQKTEGIESNEEILERVEEQQNVLVAEINLEEERVLEQDGQTEQELQVQEVGQVVEFVLQEAVICEARQEQMEEAEDIEEPQKYVFREKDDD